MWRNNDGTPTITEISTGDSIARGCYYVVAAVDICGRTFRRCLARSICSIKDRTPWAGLSDSGPNRIPLLFRAVIPPRKKVGLALGTVGKDEAAIGSMSLGILVFRTSVGPSDAELAKRNCTKEASVLCPADMI
ncbi:hypothetical protein KM043_001962 [Ampulex compressa]|nr:hypothetical protein KM043_001962 [Ampulex compressa]